MESVDSQPLGAARGPSPTTPRGPPAGLAAELAGLACVLFLGACGSFGDDPDRPKAGPVEPVAAVAAGNRVDAPHLHTWTDCGDGDQAFVRRALLGLGGRRPWSQAEVNAWQDVIAGVHAADRAWNDLPLAGTPSADERNHARKVAVRAMLRGPAYNERWSEFLMDALRVSRIETKSQQKCYGSPLPKPYDDGALARWFRDNDSLAQGVPSPGFTMQHLLSSALEADDVSVVYRAHLFAMVAQPFDAANVAALELERARRQDFGRVFDAAYLHRDLGCLSCHNSEASVTSHPDPRLNRAWPVAGRFEAALYGKANGLHPPGDEATKGSNELRAHSMLRYDGVANGSDRKAPFGWSPDCGLFKLPKNDDPLGIDTRFATVTGTKASVWDLERALQAGIDHLAQGPLKMDADGTIADPDDAFAWLVAQSVVEKVWTEAVGTRLTIANYFPRTEIQRDLLHELTQEFVASHFSLRKLLLAIATHPAFLLQPPELGCGAEPYELPPLYDPWTSAEADPAQRPNSPADVIHALSGRLLRRSLHTAMAWPQPPDYPKSAEQALQLAIGLFLKDAEPGQRGLDFQGRLAWEARYGVCQKPNLYDYVDLVAAATGTVADATLGDAVAALKDRLLGDGRIEPAEGALLEKLLGQPLATPVAHGLLEGQLRKVCGVLVSTPQFLLGGMVAPTTRDVPRLTPEVAGAVASCQDIGKAFAAAGLPYVVTCVAGKVAVERNQ